MFGSCSVAESMVDVAEDTVGDIVPSNIGKREAAYLARRAFKQNIARPQSLMKGNF